MYLLHKFYEKTLLYCHYCDSIPFKCYSFSVCIVNTLLKTRSDGSLNIDFTNHSLIIDATSKVIIEGNAKIY